MDESSPTSRGGHYQILIEAIRESHDLLLGAHQAYENVLAVKGQNQNIGPEWRASWPQRERVVSEIRDPLQATRDSARSPW